MFRRLAALAVVAHSVVLSAEAFIGKVPDVLAQVLGMGYLGVDFFFVLSGFIIMFAHMGDEGALSAVRRYSFKRLVRVFPAYLPISMALIALYAWLPGFSLLPKKKAGQVKHLGQFWIGTTSISGSVFGRRQHVVARLQKSTRSKQWGL